MGDHSEYLRYSQIEKYDKNYIVQKEELLRKYSSKFQYTNTKISYLYTTTMGLIEQQLNKAERKKKIDSFYDRVMMIKGDKGDPGNDGHTPTDAELLTLIRPLIPKPVEGHTPTKEELLAIIRPLIPKVKDGETPTDARLLALITPLIPKVENGKPGKPGADGSPDTYTEIIEKINAAPLQPQYQIRAEHIIGLPSSSFNKQGYHGGGDINMSYVLDSFLDGSKNSFTIPENRRVNYVICSSAPNIITVNDFTLSGTRNTTITFSASINATISLAQGQTVVVDYII